MENNTLSSFRFLDYNIDDIKFVLNEEFDVHKSHEDEVEVDMGIGVRISLSEGNKNARVSLSMNIFRDAEKNNYPYTLSLDMIARFELSENISKEDAIRFCKVNGTAVMFPYIRSAITDITKLSNVEPLVLPLINIHKLIENQETEEKETEK